VIPSTKANNDQSASNLGQFGSRFFRRFRHRWKPEEQEEETLPADATIADADIFNMFDSVQFQSDLIEFTIPILIGALLASDRSVLRAMCSQTCFDSLNGPIRHREKNELFLHSELLDIRLCTVKGLNFIDDNPVVSSNFVTHQTNWTCDSVGKDVDGSPGQVVQVHYLMTMIRNKSDSGWIISELRISGISPTW